MLCVSCKEPSVVYCEAFCLFFSIALNALYVKIANTSMLNEHSLQKDCREGKDCTQQASPWLGVLWLGANFLSSWFQKENFISCLVGLPHSSRCWCWRVYVNTAAAGAHSTGDDLQGMLCCWGLCCASTGDQPLDATEMQKKRRVKGDLWLKFHVLMLFTNFYTSTALLINDCSWNAMCQQWITYFCCTSVVYG